MQRFLQYLSQHRSPLSSLQICLSSNGIFFWFMPLKVNQLKGKTFGCGNIFPVLMFFYSSLEIISTPDIKLMIFLTTQDVDIPKVHEWSIHSPEPLSCWRNFGYWTLTSQLLCYRTHKISYGAATYRRLHSLHSKLHVRFANMQPTGSWLPGLDSNQQPSR